MLLGLLLYLFLAKNGVRSVINSTKNDLYDVEHLVSELGLQFCTIVEIGQGLCSIFLEVRDKADSPELVQGGVADVFLGECQCSSLREWSLCSPHLVEARGETCRFKEATGRDPTSQRVHRRFCDFDHIQAAENRPCDCHKRLDDSPYYPVKGLGTCFRSPLPNSLCGRHSVCGVYGCHSAAVEGYAMVQCDRNCKGKQPFCEDPMSKAPVVTSYWSEWTRPENIGFASAKVSVASCLAANTRAPAFDCLGPGPYCCPPDQNCFCDVEYTITGKKVRRFTNIDSHLNMARSIAKIVDRSHWKRLLLRIEGLKQEQHHPVFNEYIAQRLDQVLSNTKLLSNNLSSDKKISELNQTSCSDIALKP